MIRSLRSVVIWFLALWRGLNLKQIGARAGIHQKQVSKILKRREIADEDYEPLLAAVARRPAEAQVVAGCLEDLEDLESAADLSDEELEETERGVQEGRRLLRSIFTRAARLSRNLPPFDEYPKPEHLEAARWHAGLLWSLLEEMTEDQRLAVVRLCRECQTWWLMERVCDESETQASRNLERAASLARLAQEIADRVRGPEGWCSSNRGYAAAHGPNVLRVAGELKSARVGLEEAKRHWSSGWDPGHVLDPGRLLDLEASLCRDECQCEKALALLAQAFPVSHNPGRVLLKKGYTLEAMGDCERAIETLLQAKSLVERQGDARLLYMTLFNLAVNQTHLGRIAEASDLVDQVRELAGERGDENEIIRVIWLEGRLAAALGRPAEARMLLEQARREFATREMWYSVALAQQELAVLLLEEGRSAEVKELARDLVEIFESKGVHREALAALQLFCAAAEREEASAELARRVLRYLFRAQYDQGLQFTDSFAPGAAAGVHPAAVVGHGLGGAGAAAGVHPAPILGVRGAPERGEEGEERGGKDDGEESWTHRAVSGAAPAPGLHGPRGPRLPAMVRQKGAKIPRSEPVEMRLTWKQRLARLFRALAGLTQTDFGEVTGVNPILIDRYEQGKAEPSPENLRREAEGAGLTVQTGEEVLRFADTLRRPRQRAGLGRAPLFQELEALAARLSERLLRLPPAASPPRAEDRRHAEVLWAQLKDLPVDQQLAVVRAGRDFQSWALAVRCCDESETEASRQLERAASLARLAQEIADRVPGPEGWRNRIGGYAAAHSPNITRVAGDLVSARAGFESTKRRWLAGSDPEGLLDPGRLLDLEASLCRDECEFEKALALLDEAFPVSHNPGRVLIKKGYTLEAMGDYERAIETLLQAKPLVERQGDPRQQYMLHFNLAVCYTHLDRFAEATRLVRQVREAVAERGDEHEACRVLWLEGRIAAGLGQPEKARSLLSQARQGFAAREMWYSVALADLEIAVLLLAEGRTAEVQEMARELVAAFESRNVHREALAALRLFREAAEREEATSELARRVLRYLFRAQHNENLRFEGS